MDDKEPTSVPDEVNEPASPAELKRDYEPAQEVLHNDIAPSGLKALAAKISKKYWIIILLVLICIFAGWYYAVSQKEVELPLDETPPGGFETTFPSAQQGNTSEMAEGIVVAEGIESEYLESVIIPFYSARLNGETDDARSYFQAYFDGPYQNDDWPTEEWPADLSGAEVTIVHIHSGEKGELSSNDTFDTIQYTSVLVYIVLDEQQLEETIYIETLSDSADASSTEFAINSLSYSSVNSRVVSDDSGKAYVVFLEAENKPENSPTILIANADASDGCGRYNTQSPCVVLRSNNPDSNENWEVLATIESSFEHLGTSSHFSYVDGSPRTVEFVTAFGDAGISFENLNRMDVDTGAISSYAKIDSDVFVDKNSANVPAEMATACVGYTRQTYSISTITLNESNTATIWECGDETTQEGQQYNASVLVVAGGNVLNVFKSTATNKQGSYAFIFNVAEDVIDSRSVNLTIFGNKYALNIPNKSLTPVQ